MLSLHNYKYLLNLLEQGRISGEDLLRYSYYSGSKLDDGFVEALIESGAAYDYEPENA